ncbi:TIGR02186 family protein [Cochlodiniinecator piscidefendens]|uniref:TIGR02186 family protein n=1 Tax=Cochlodiniinecator piscidefendens TaxID=2715756 RepID=UPI0014074B8D|nr:TIGR02186 family protein [Cochlodiniinecator piscidefendens]
MLLRALFFCLAFALPTHAEQVVAGLSQNRVAITANFDGSEILIFGAVQRETPAPTFAPLEVIVAISGPSHAVTVRRKTHQYGIWVNTDAVEVDEAPTFYAVATSGPLDEILLETEDLRHHISVNRAIRSVGAPEEISDSEAFTDAIIRIRMNNGLYQTLDNTVEVSEETLFNTSIALPANLTEGDYTTRIFLTRGGEVIDVFETSIDVRKVGLERWVYNLAHEQPLIYGLLSLFIAIAAGWGASAFFRFLNLRG